MLPLLAFISSFKDDITFSMTVGQATSGVVFTGYSRIGTPIGTVDPTPLYALGFPITQVLHADGSNDQIVVQFDTGGMSGVIPTGYNKCKMYIDGALYPHDLDKGAAAFFYLTPGFPIANPFGPPGTVHTIRLQFLP